MVKCPYCGNESNLISVKSWKFRGYNVTLYKCPKCDGLFNYYVNTGTTGKAEYYIRIKPRPARAAKEPGR